MKRIPGVRIESFSHPRHGAVAAVIADGRTGEGDVGAFLSVDGAGVPVVVGPAALPSDAKHDLAAMYDHAAAARRRVDWSTALSDGLAFFGLFRPDGRSAVDACVRAAAIRATPTGDIPAAAGEELAARIRPLLRDALAPVIAGIDAEALHALRAASSFTRSDFAFYARGDGSAAAMERRKRRLQAAAAYPTLAAAMARNLRAKLAIDGSKPLADELILAFGKRLGDEPVFSKGLLRRLQGLDWPVPEGVSPEWLAERIGEIPADWFPKTPEDWEAFLTVARGLGRTLPQRIGVPFGELVKGCGGKWVDFRRRVAKAYTDTRPPEDLDEEARRAWLRSPPKPDESFEALANAATDLADMVDAFSRLVVLPAAGLASGDSKPCLSESQRAAARHAAAGLLFGGKNAAAMFEISRHYHTRAEHVMEAATGQAAPSVEYRRVAEDGWPPLCNQVQAPNGVWIVPLTDPRELAAEGRGYSGKSALNEDGSEGLGHCVGGYSSSCRDAGHHILSFRTIPESGVFQRLSTIEIEPVTEGDKSFKVRQHRGKRNNSPPEIAKAAWIWFQDAVWSGSVPLNHAGLRNYLSVQAARKDDDVERACGYKWREDGAVEQALRAFDEWLGKGLRGMPGADFAALPEIQRVAEEIMPRRAALPA